MLQKKKRERLWHRCFPVNFVKISRTPFLQNTIGRRIELHQAKKIVLSLLYHFWEKNTVIENIFKTRKKSTKNHIDSCYYAMLLMNSFLCRFTAEKYKLI